MTSWTPFFATLPLVAVVTLAAAAPAPQQPASAGRAGGGDRRFLLTICGRSSLLEPADLGSYRASDAGGERRERHAAIRRRTPASRSCIVSCRERASPCWAFPATTSAVRSRAPRRKSRRSWQAYLRRHVPDVAKVSTAERSRPIADLQVPRGLPADLPAWNFSKYVVDKDGKVVAFFRVRSPRRAALRNAIAKALWIPADDETADLGGVVVAWRHRCCRR